MNSNVEILNFKKKLTQQGSECSKISKLNFNFVRCYECSKQVSVSSTHSGTGSKIRRFEVIRGVLNHHEKRWEFFLKTPRVFSNFVRFETLEVAVDRRIRSLKASFNLLSADLEKHGRLVETDFLSEIPLSIIMLEKSNITTTFTSDDIVLMKQVPGTFEFSDRLYCIYLKIVYNNTLIENSLLTDFAELTGYCFCRTENYTQMEAVHDYVNVSKMVSDKVYESEIEQVICGLMMEAIFNIFVEKYSEIGYKLCKENFSTGPSNFVSVTMRLMASEFQDFDSVDDSFQAFARLVVRVHDDLVNGKRIELEYLKQLSNIIERRMAEVQIPALNPMNKSPLPVLIFKGFDSYVKFCGQYHEEARIMNQVIEPEEAAFLKHGLSEIK